MPRKTNKRSNRLPAKLKLPRRHKVTVNDLLARDDVNDIINHLNEAKPNITNAIVIYMDKRDGKYYWNCTRETASSLAVWLLESVKLDILADDKEDADA